MRVRRYERLHHNHAGVVSLSGDGSEVAITLTKALSLDSGYQVTYALQHSAFQHYFPLLFAHAVSLYMHPQFALIILLP